MRNYMSKLLVALLAVVGITANACAKQNKEMNNDSKQENSKVLVAYFSATGTTKAAAEKLAKAAGADLYEIAPAQAYTAADLDWHDKASRSTVEMQDPKSRPEIGGKQINTDSYDTVFIGFPIWWYVAPRIINTFIESHDLKGKAIYLFATSGGSTVDGSLEELKKEYPDLDFRGCRLLNDDKAEEWVNSLGLK